MPDNDNFERTPLTSKKFIAFLVAEASWKVVLGVLLILGVVFGQVNIYVGALAMAIIIVAGAIEALYIGGQAGLDKFTRIAQIATRAGHSFSMGSVTVTKPAEMPVPIKTAETKTDEG